MTQTTPREVHVVAVLGGALIGLGLMAFGMLMFSAAYNSGSATNFVNAIEGATFFSTGAAFLLVSIILVPALRAMQLESVSRTRGS